MFQFLSELIIGVIFFYLFYSFFFKNWTSLSLKEREDELEDLEESSKTVTRLKKEHGNIDGKKKQVEEFINKK